MKQKKIIITISLIIIAISVLLFLSEKKYQKTFVQNGVTYAVLVNNVASASIPNQGNYSVEVNCQNAKGKWNYDTWKLEVSNIIGNISCNLAFTSFTPSNEKFNDYIIDTSNGECSNSSYTVASTCIQNSGSWTASGHCSISEYANESDCKLAGACYNIITNAINTSYATESTCKEAGYSWKIGEWSGVFNENGFRYEGNDPDNYVWFNNEMWRIIGVFDTYYDNNSTHNYLVKLIRADSIGSLVWHYASDATWNNSSLKDLLNNYYYKGSDYPVSYFGETNACSGRYGLLPTDCNYSNNGITNTQSRNMIANARWNNSFITDMDTAQNLYTNSDSVYDSVHSEYGHVGLMYASDYGYGVLASTCDRSRKIESYLTYQYVNNTCASQNWLLENDFELIMAQYNLTNAWYLRNNGGINYSSISVGFNVRPVVYLKPNTYRIAGDGSYNDPYIIGL